MRFAHTHTFAVKSRDKNFRLIPARKIPGFCKTPSRKSWDWKFLIPLEPVYSTLKYAQIFYLAYLPVFGRIYALTYMSAHQIWISGVSLKRPSKVQFRHIVDLWSIWPSCQILWPNQVLTTIYTMTSMTIMTTVTTMTTITTMTTVDYYWQIPKLKSSHWGLVIYNQIVTWTAFAILEMFANLLMFHISIRWEE